MTTLKKNKAQSTFHIVTLGCPKNTVDSDKMYHKMVAAGFAHVDSPEEADAIIINTCGFIEAAKQQSVQTVMSASKLKEKYPEKKIIAVGCLTERYLTQLKKEWEGKVDALHGVYPQDNIVSILENLGLERKPENCNQGLQSKSLVLQHSRYLRISEGCSNACTFCAIPLMKGYFNHRTKQDILLEAQEYVINGAKEITIIGQDTTSYISKKDRIHHILEEISQLEGDFWIRLMYAYPKRLSQEAIDVIRENPKVCSYIDMPIQHINTEVLTRMNRRVTRSDIEKTIDELQKSNIAIRTTLIVGFPGETKEQFQELRDWIQERRLDRVGVFTYSSEEGTVAGTFPDDVSQEEKQERLHEIMTLQQKISLEKNQAKKGKTFKTLIDEHRNGYSIGRTEQDACDVDNNVLIPSVKHPVGQFVQVKVKEAYEYDIKGDVI